MTTTPTTAAKRWPFVESPGDFAKRLERAIWSFSGDTLAAVRNVLIENPPTFATPAETAQPATPEPELLQAPQLPSDLIQRISEYGDARADDGNTGEALAVAIRAIRAWGAALATQASALQAAIPAQQPAVEPAGWRLVPVEPTKEMRKACDNGPGAMVLTNSEIYRAMIAAAPVVESEEPVAWVSLSELRWLKLYQHAESAMTSASLSVHRTDFHTTPLYASPIAQPGEKP